MSRREPDIKATEFDPMAGATIEYVQEGDRLHIRKRIEVDSLMLYAHEKRREEGYKGKNKFRKVLKGGFKSIGVTPVTIFTDHPELIQDQEYMKRLFEEKYPKWKTTNAKLGRNKR